MRALALLGTAAHAEGLRMRREAERTLRLLVLQAVAAVFALAALGLLHGAAFLWLEPRHGALDALLLLAAADAVLMLVFLLLARRRRDPVAEEALRLRRRSLAELGRLSPIGEVASLVTGRAPAYAVGGIVAERMVRGLLRR